MILNISVHMPLWPYDGWISGVNCALLVYVVNSLADTVSFKRVSV